MVFSSKETSTEVLESLLKSTLLNPITVKIPAEKITKYFDIKKESLEVMNYIDEKKNEYQKYVENAIQQANQIN